MQYSGVIEALPMVGKIMQTTHEPTNNKPSTGSAHAPGAQTPTKAKTPAQQEVKAATSTSSARSAECNSGVASHGGLASSGSAQLRALAAFEKACVSSVANTASFFAPTPTNAAQAQSYAADIVAQLRAFSANGISPLIFLEPTSEGNIIDFNQYAAGAFTPVLNSYFKAIKAAGISDDQMGLWVSFPEGNIPVWTSVDPSVYATNVTITMQAMKSVFPAAKAGLLLDSVSYPSAGSWSGGRQVSLLPYVRNIPKGLINSFGLQGFPWAPPANEAGPASFDPQTYLRIDEAKEAARTLGISEIWMNTGTFSKSYANNSARMVLVSATERQRMLDGVIVQAQALKRDGFTVAVHLFSENKTNVNEAIDWSYWQDSQNSAVFKTFAHDAQSSGIPLWIFDS